MEFDIFIVIDIWSLSDALKKEYGWDLEGHTICQLMFDDSYMNDCYKRYYFKDTHVYSGFPWENEDRINNINKINTFLRKTFPNYDEVLVDVSW